MRPAPLVTGLFAGAFLLAAALPADAQIQDSRWLPFVGCWEPVDGAEDAGLLCIRPSGAGVELSSIAGGQVASTESLVADGERRPVVTEGCDGWEAVSFSADGRRAFTESEFVCGDDERSGTGVMSFVAPNRWVDVRALEVQGENVAWVQEYMLVGIDRLAELGIDDPEEGLEFATRPARRAAATRIELEDVEEATTRMDQEAVVAWVAAQQDPFDVDGDDLIRLADSGVPEDIIDVVVAVSFPERFVVEPEEAIQPVDSRVQGRRVPVGYGYRSYLWWDPFYRYGYSSFGFRYSPFGYGYGFGYPYGYGYGYGYRPVVVRVQPRAPSGGRLYSGRGYVGPSGASTGRTARPRGAASSLIGRALSRLGSRRSGGASAGSSSRGAVSRGGARSSGGRTARPRGSGRRR